MIKVKSQPDMQDRKARRPGLVLVVVLWVTVVAAVLALALAQNTRLDNAVRVAVSDRVTARWLARAGVYRALSEIYEDYNINDSPADTWYDSEDLFRHFILEGGNFSVYADRFKEDNSCAWGVVDEASKLNLNTASREALLALPGMNENLAEAIIEWRENRLLMQSGYYPEDILYNELFLTGYGEGPISRVRELALLEGMTEELLFGEDANGNGVLDGNENDGDATAPPDNQDGVLDRGLMSYLTVYSFEYNQDGYGRERININTTDKDTMLNQLGLTICQANWILLNRATGLTSIAELLEESASLEFSTVVCEKEDQSIPLDVATFRRIADRISVSDDEIIPGRININTACAAVLQTLPGVDEQWAERIIQYRTKLPEGFTSIAELLSVPEMTIGHFKELAALITVRSNVFTVRSCGHADRTDLIHEIEAVIVRDMINGPSVIYWRETR